MILEGSELVSVWYDFITITITIIIYQYDISST